MLRGLGVFLALWMCGSVGAASAADLVASLSKHLVAITTGFTGASVLLFGATDGPGDVVVVIQGPRADEVVRRRGRKLGIWINEAEVAFADVPQFYAIASSAPIVDILSPDIARDHEIGIDHVVFRPITSASPSEIAQFRAALISNRQRGRLYAEGLGDVLFLGNRLFRTDFWIPANAAVGHYSVHVYMVRDGDVVSAEVTPLLVSKVGIEARLYDFAHRYALAYGVVAVGLAGMAGWIANLLYRRR